MALITSNKALIDKTWKLFVRYVKSCAFASDSPLSWCARITILGAFFCVAIYITREWLREIVEWLFEPFPEHINDNAFISVALFICGGLPSLGAWVLSTHDRKKELKNSLHAQHEILFQNAVETVLSGEPLAKRILALYQLASLKHRNVIKDEQIDQVTGSNLNLCTRDDKGARITETANLADADLSDMLLSGVDLQGADLLLANLQHANLQYANLQDANLQYAKLQYANLQSARLQGARLQNAELEHSRYDSNTIFPADFDPAQHGMKEQP